MYVLSTFKSQDSPQIKHIHSFCCHLLKKWSSSSLQWTVVWKLIRHCCALIQRTDVCWVWVTVTLVYRNIQVATATIECIQLLQGMWVLAWVKWADLSAPYIKVISCQAAYFVKSFNPFLTTGLFVTFVELKLSIQRSFYRVQKFSKKCPLGLYPYNPNPRTTSCLWFFVLRRMVCTN